MPVTEHPFYGSWGYQTTGYFAPTARYGTPQDFMYLVDHLHQRGIGVILDWVPSHFPGDEHGLAYFDGTHLYEHADPRQGFHPEWNSYIFNYGRHEVRSFLTSSALFWLDRYHIDGLRVDARRLHALSRLRAPGTASGCPTSTAGRENLEAVAFLRGLNEAVYREFPDVQTIAEESTAWPAVSRPVYVGGLGFGMKWNMGWMHDTLDYFSQDPVFRNYHHDQLTFSAWYAFSENFVLPLSHDEVVHGKGSLIGKMPGDNWQQFANLRCLFGYMWGASRQEAPFHGRGIRPAPRVAARGKPRVARPAVRRSQRRARLGARSEPLLPRVSPRCTSRTSTRPASSGSTATTPRTACVSFVRQGALERLRRCWWSATSRPVPRLNYVVGVPRRRLLAGSAEQRRERLRRQRHGQLRRRRSAARTRARLRPIPRADAAAAIGAPLRKPRIAMRDRDLGLPNGRRRAVIEKRDAERRRRPLPDQALRGRPGGRRGRRFRRRPRPAALPAPAPQARRSVVERGRDDRARQRPLAGRVHRGRDRIATNTPSQRGSITSCRGTTIWCAGPSPRTSRSRWQPEPGSSKPQPPRARGADAQRLRAWAKELDRRRHARRAARARARRGLERAHRALSRPQPANA